MSGNLSGTKAEFSLSGSNFIFIFDKLREPEAKPIRLRMPGQPQSSLAEEKQGGPGAEATFRFDWAGLCRSSIDSLKQRYGYYPCCQARINTK
ncbi:MAG: hypothetical protein LIP00_05740 [Parabacteroides sp.]|nr:hypothetical protein [Parabacteroides sp.]